MSSRAMLMESRNTMKSMHGVDLTSMVDFKNMIINDNQFTSYKATLMESITSGHQPVMGAMIDRMRMKLMESINSTYQLTPYETLSLPILHAFYPRLITKELVTVRPIDAPDTLMPFMDYKFVDAAGNVLGSAPYMNNASYGPGVTVADDKHMVLGANDVLADNSLTADTTSLERTFAIYSVTATNGGTEETADVNIRPTVDGNFFGTAVFATIGTMNVSGVINFDTGVVNVMADGAGYSNHEFNYTCTFSLEQNTMNNKIKPGIEKIRLIVEDQEISADWTIQLEQDFNALFDIDIQAQIIDILGKQMALDVDHKIIGHILQKSMELPANHIETFDRTPPAGYTLGPIYWYQNILEKLTKLSAQIYTDTNIGEGNVIACNPVDAAIFESLNKFSFDGKGADGGAMGYSTGSLAQRWKVFSSPVVSQGTMHLLHKPTDVLESIYVFSPYQPAVMSPYPLGNTPSLTILSRNARKFYRPLGAAKLNITAS